MKVTSIYFIFSMIGNTPSIETSETDTAGASMTRRSSSGGLLSPEVELGGIIIYNILRII